MDSGLPFPLQHRFGHNYVFVTNYTDSYCLSGYDFEAALATPTNSQPFNRRADWGPCVFDTRHNLNASLVATSSWPGSNPWARHLLSNLVFAPLIHASSGQPLIVTTGKDDSLTALNNDRPNQVLSNIYPVAAGCASAP
jgi:hypothetical protein